MKASIGFAKLELTAKELDQLSRDLGRAIGKTAGGVTTLARGIAKAAIPQYRECVKGLYDIATIIRHAVWNVEKTCNDFIYFSFDKGLALEELRAMCEPFVEQSGTDIARNLKFNCGDIEAIYQDHCERPLHSIYARVVRGSRRAEMRRALEEMKHHDAEMIALLVEKIVEPIAAFAREAVKAKNIETVRPRHARLVRQIERNVAQARGILDGLDGAVSRFAQLARTPLRRPAARA